MADEVKYRGVSVRMNGIDYIVPSLSLRQFKDNHAKLTAPIGEINEETMIQKFTEYIPVIALALQRNYPDFKEDELWDILDLASFGEVLRAVQGASGLKAAKLGEE